MKKFSLALILLLVLIFCFSSVSLIVSADDAVESDAAETTTPETKPLFPEFTDPTKGESRVAYLSARRYLGVLANATIKEDNTLQYHAAGSSSWTNKDLTYLYQFTHQGNGTRFSFFVGYEKPTTANELVVGDITHWLCDTFWPEESRYERYTYKDDLDTLSVYIATDPNGTWTKVETTNVRYNCDRELGGTYKYGGLRFIFDEPVVANYFLIIDSDPNPRRLWIAANGLAAVKQGDVEDMTLPVVDTTVAETEEVSETTAGDTTDVSSTDMDSIDVDSTMADAVTEPDETTTDGVAEKDNNATWYVIMGIEALVIVVLAVLLIVKKKKN